MLRKLLAACLTSVSFTSCVSYAYFQSPLHTTATAYKTIPMRDDSIRSATYAGAAMSISGVNDKWRDELYQFSIGAHRSHNFGSFQAYYGGIGMLGNYKVDSIFNNTGQYRNESVNDSLINAHSGNKMFAAGGVFGSINFITPIDKGEWRVLGAEVSCFKEYGNYMRFRNELPDTAANFIERKNTFTTISISSEIVGIRDYGSMGYKFGVVLNPRTLSGYDKSGKPWRSSSLYVSQTLHFELDRNTIYLQWNTGTHAIGLLAGANFRF